MIKEIATNYPLKKLRNTTKVLKLRKIKFFFHTAGIPVLHSLAALIFDHIFI